MKFYAYECCCVVASNMRKQTAFSALLTVHNWVNFESANSLLCKLQLKKNKVLFCQQTSTTILFSIIVSIQHFIGSLYKFPHVHELWVLSHSQFKYNQSLQDCMRIDISNQQSTQIVSFWVIMILLHLINMRTKSIVCVIKWMMLIEHIERMNWIEES
jgi:hypothetical protein